LLEGGRQAQSKNPGIQAALHEKSPVVPRHGFAV
jgi:hypothetical protein